MAGIFNRAIFNDAIFNTATVAPAQASGGGRVRHKEVRYAMRIDGEWLSFPTLEALYAYLEEVVERKEEQVEEKAEAFAGRIISLGRVPRKKPAAPEVRIAKAPQEVVDYVAKINERLEKLYRDRLSQALSEMADEDDIEILLMGVI